MAGDSRVGDLTSIETDADRSRLNLSKKIFQSKNYRKMRRLRWLTKLWIMNRAVPSPLRHGTFLIPQPLVEEVLGKINEAEEQFNKLADEFIEEYPVLVKEAKDLLQSQFRKENYPNPKSMRGKFWVSRMFVKFENVKGVNQNKEIQDAIEDIRGTLRMGMLELVEKLGKMLGEGKNGRKSVVRKEAIQAFNDWMELLPKRNVLDDEELKSLAEKAKSLMKGNTQSDLRDVEGIRSKVRKGMGDISKQLRTMIEAAPRRSFSFEE
jgi:polyhydroxyalkanoate synthesis regulator phasin